MNSRMRMDFVVSIKSLDKETGVAEIFLMPNPKRYKTWEENGETWVFDEFDKVKFPLKIMVEAFEKSGGNVPIYYQPPQIEDAGAYVLDRLQPIREMLDGGTSPPTFEDKSEDFLRSLSADKLDFVILSLDIVGSTKLATGVNADQYARLISMILFEVSNVVPQFHGHVLKYTGDGIIAYFPAPSFITKNDLALDCALALRLLFHKAINVVLGERSFPQIDVRIGLDAGEAAVVVMGSAETKQHMDIIGSVVSLAAKIQSCANPGQILMGDVVVKNLHTGWRQYCSQIDPGKGWSYKNSEGETYQIHDYQG